MEITRDGDKIIHEIVKINSTMTICSPFYILLVFQNIFLGCDKNNFLILSQKTDKDEAEPMRHRRESTPPMLRPSNPTVSSLSSEDATVSSSGQESLEAFLNMSQSKGIDSFINLGEPEFSDALMNVSQPSILCTSLMSMTRDDLSQTLTTQSPTTIDQSQTSSQPGIEDSQILTESMMQTSMFGEFADVNFNDTFAKNSANITVLENTSCCVSFERTFIASPEPITRETLKSSFETRNFNGMDATYTPSRLSAALASDLLPNDPHASFIVNHHTYRKSDIKHALNDASFVVSNAAASDASFIIGTAEPDLQNCDERDETFDVTRKFDATFENAPAEGRKTSANSTFQRNTPTSGKLFATIEQRDTLDVPMNFDATFETTPAESPRKSSANSTFQTGVASSGKLLSTIEQRDTLDVTKTFEATFENARAESPREPPANSTFQTHESSSGKSSSIIDDNLDATLENTSVSSTMKSSVNSTFRAAEPVSENAEIVEPNGTFNVQEFDATFERPASTSPRKSYVNSTFKAPGPPIEKSSLTNDHAFNLTYKTPTRMDTTYEHNTVECENDVPATNRYNTYRKAPERTRKENYPSNNLTAKVDENVDTVNRVSSLENLGSTFRKPAAKAPSKLNAPRALSRLPQGLQKSNPNLISNSLKSINTVGHSAIPSFGFRKIARPSTARNVEGSLSSKLYATGKVKSGSEQRLEATRNPGEFQMTGTGGSTESIESTQSAHSAPDFDDRLSVCSDSSNTSYSMRSMNIDDLQKIVRLREECEFSRAIVAKAEVCLSLTGINFNCNGFEKVHIRSGLFFSPSSIGIRNFYQFSCIIHVLERKSSNSQCRYLIVFSIEKLQINVSTNLLIFLQMHCN